MIGMWGWTLRPLLSNFSSSAGADLPSTMSPQVAAWQSELVLTRALYEGWEAVRARCRDFLPQHPKEANEDYLIRVNRPTFYNAFGRTVRSLAGTVFKQPPAREGIPSEILDLYDSDIDLQGTQGDPFCLHTFTDALATGLAGILVDMPENTGGKTLLEAQELDIRPYWSLIRKDDIISFRTDIVNGKTVLGQLVLHELVEVGSGDFGVKIREQFCVYRRTEAGVTSETWSANKSGKLRADAPPVLFRGVTEIPFAPIYTSRDAFMCSPSPLLDLGNLNLLHYQLNSDLHHAAHIANVPIGVTHGFEGEVQVGPNRWINFPLGVEGKAYWMETTGASLGSTRAILADIEAQMAALGLGMLQRQTRAAETAEKASLDRKEQDSTLAGIVGDLENGLDMALGFTAQFLGMDFEEGGHLEFTREFVAEPAASQRNENDGAPREPKEPKQPGETNNAATTGAR